MTFQPRVTLALVLVQPDLTLLVLKATLHAPAREGDQQQSPDAGPHRRVAHEALHRGRVQNLAGEQQVERLPGKPSAPLTVSIVGLHSQTIGPF